MSLPANAFGFYQLTGQQVIDYNAIRVNNPNSDFPVIRADQSNVWWAFIEQIDPQRVHDGWPVYTDWANELWEEIVTNGGGTLVEPTWPVSDL